MTLPDPIVFLVDVDNTLLDNDRVAADLMRQLGATYVIGSTAPDCAMPVDFAASSQFEEVYAEGAVTIFHLSSAP